MKKRRLTKAEQRVMELFWNSDKELCVNDILDIDPSLKRNTVLVVLRNLLENGYIEIMAYSRVTRVYARMYKAVISKEQYYLQYVMNELSIERLISAAFESSDEDDLTKFEALLREAKRKKGL